MLIGGRKAADGAIHRGARSALDPAHAGELVRALRALGGRATQGDLIMATGLSRAEIDEAMAHLMSHDRLEVSVSESAVLVYRLAHPEVEARPRAPRAPSSWPGRPEPSRTPRYRDAFDRKTLRLIRARGGVISIAELVEHTGLTVDAARRDVQRLAALYGGEPHPSWDEHVVYAFPELMESAHGDFHVREPRPAWVRSEDPLEGRDAPDRNRRLVFVASGAAGVGLLAWFATFPPAGWGRVAILAAVAGASSAAAFVVTGSLLRRIARHPLLRPYRSQTLRRYVLGYVFETALRGKGVVSLTRTVAYLRTRTGSTRVSRRRVEGVLRRLAEEFEATVSELDGDLFFGFRNVKRQFLASHVQRIRLQLDRRARGATVFDSGDSEAAAAARELEAFDRELREAPAPLLPRAGPARDADPR